ncbi:hypothetical protein GCM10009680_58020 [Streptomyces yatensis]|uniref:Transposase IS701-like DDE domain-containing protein n=1 Tax=Streptomyces yatensis TaxID=155177 RepID=A0ABN2IPZ9_9ACTN
MQLRAGNDKFDELFLRTGHRFRRAEPRRRTRDYIRGLLGPVGRKDGWHLAECTGHRTPGRLQRLLNGARWDADDPRDDLRHYVAERLDEPDGILILDDAGFLKKGTTSAGVQRRHSGTAGRTENCQIGVFAAYATTGGRALVDRELYLPKSSTDDRDRCRAAHIPGRSGLRHQAGLAKAMALWAMALPPPIAWVTADAAYGQEWRLRLMLEETGLGYVLAVPKSQQVPHLGRIDRLFAQAPDEAWERRSCGDGAKGPRIYHWAALQSDLQESMGLLVKPGGWPPVGRSGGQRRKLRVGALGDQGEDAAGGGQVRGGYPAPDAGAEGGRSPRRRRPSARALHPWGEGARRPRRAAAWPAARREWRGRRQDRP